MSGNAFVTRKNHYLMPAHRSGTAGKHFVMLGNGLLTQKCASAIGKRRQRLKFRGVPSEN